MICACSTVSREIQFARVWARPVSRRLLQPAVVTTGKQHTERDRGTLLHQIHWLGNQSKLPRIYLMPTSKLVIRMVYEA